MKYWVGITDQQWFEYLKALKPDEVNFWQPGGARSFRAIQTGAPFLFKLHSPLNYIVGGGYFVRHSVLPLSVAWNYFGEKNGASSQYEAYEIIRKYRERRNDMTRDPFIGCIILIAPFFFERADWIPVPEDWSPNLVQGRTYDTDQPTGGRLWAEVQARFPERARTLREDRVPYLSTTPDVPRYGQEYVTRGRLGQGTFRVLVTEAYEKRCAVTGERTLPVLQAAHIKPFAQHGPNSVSNGLLLRSDLHILFDTGLLTIDRDYRIEVSKRIREEYENGQEYYAMSGSRLKIIPQRPEERPSEEYIEWHNTHVFVA